MAIRIESGLENTDAIDLTLTITMTLGEWKSFVTDLTSKYPDWKIREAVNEMVYKAQTGVNEVKKIG